MPKKILWKAQSKTKR